MNKKALAVLLVGLTCLLGKADLPQDPAEYAAWEARLLQAIEKQKSLPAHEAIPKLGRWTMQLAMQHNREHGERPVFHAAQAALLAIPGHAEYYANQVREARRLFDEAEGPNNKSPLAVNLQNVQGRSFGTLAHLPSVETVRVLGEFLSDEKGYVPDVPTPGVPVSEGWKGTGPAFFYATQAFNTLPLVSKPFQKEHAYQIGYDDVHPWRLWYEQVKAGTRTFRFEGDPQEYNLDGPVREAKHGPATNREARRNAADGTLAEEHATGFTPFRAVMTLMAVLLCLWALWRCWKMRPGSAA